MMRFLRKITTSVLLMLATEMLPFIKTERTTKIAYSLSSNTYEDASVAQFALYSGQTINITGFPAGGYLLYL